MSIPAFPTIVTRSGKGAPLLDAEMDSNWNNIKAYCLTLANLIAGALNPDGTLIAGSVGSNALQAAAVTLASLNPSLLYSIVPVDTDTGTTAGAYVITASGGLGGTNIVSGAAKYDANGNYVVTGLTLNYGYYWTHGANDISCVTSTATTLTASGAFHASSTSVTITGQPNASVTAQLAQVAPVNAYKNGQMFFVYTGRANAGAATLNVNNIGAVPILQSGSPLKQNAITAASVFAVVYMGGSFTLFSGGSSTTSSTSSGTGNASSTINYTLDTTTVFASDQIAIPTTGTPPVISVSHGLGVIPMDVSVTLVKTATDSTSYAVGEYVPVWAFASASGARALLVNFDATAITVTQVASGVIYINGVAITNASWAIVIQATKITGVANTIVGPYAAAKAYASGAFSYLNNLVVGDFNSHIYACYNVSTNRAIALTAATSGTPYYSNFSVFRRASGQIQAIATTATGLYAIPVTNPGSNVVPAYAAYDGTGNYTLTVNSGGYYTWTNGANDISYTNGGSVVTTTPSNFTAASATITLQGTPYSVITATVVTLQTSGGAVMAWQPSQISSSVIDYTRKPVKIVEANNIISDVYVVTSNPGSGSSNALYMNHWSGIPGSVTQGRIGTTVNIANSSINNNSEIVNWYGSTAALVLLFQYNPITNRIYVITNRVGGIHVFQLAAGTDLVTWWNATSGSPAVPAYSSLTYVKTIGLDLPFGGVTNWGNIQFFVEWDQNTGLEICTVATFDGYGGYMGSVYRAPWIEGA